MSQGIVSSLVGLLGYFYKGEPEPGVETWTANTIPYVEQHNYNIESQPFAIGSSSEVFTATEEEGGADVVAVKVCTCTREKEVRYEPSEDHTPEERRAYLLEFDRASSEICLESVDREVELLKSVQPSPFIVDLIEAFRTIGEYSGESLAYIVMENSKTTLQAVRSVIRPNLVQMKVIANDILNGILHIHSKGIVHCDIKAENMLMDQNGFIKICDFGIAAKVDPETNRVPLSIRRVGTTNYMAPELFCPLGLVNSFDYSVDTWAYGILLYYIVHGHTPFKGDDFEGFTDANWALYQQGDMDYFINLLGPAVVDFNKNPEVKHQLYNPEDEGDSKLLEQITRRSKKYRQMYDVMLRCLVPYPRTGTQAYPILRTDTSDRIAATALGAMELHASARRIDKDLSRHWVKQLMTKAAKHERRTLLRNRARERQLNLSVVELHL